MNPVEVYRGRRVLVTGHTGFKGSWLVLQLADLGAHVTGLALPPETPSLFEDAGIAGLCDHRIGDVRDAEVVTRAVRDARPEITFHLAAQSLVRRAHARPVETFATNVLGTVNVLEALRTAGRRCAAVIVTSDKCYRPSPAPLAEDDPLGGDEPYAASKAAAEHVAAAYRSAYGDTVAIATARAGNVIGGGDWSEDRIVPDAVRALVSGRPVAVRNPEHIRPWQHALDPLSGYLVLGARLASSDDGVRASAAGPWNLGPRDDDVHSVRDLVDRFIAAWGAGSWTHAAERSAPSETGALRLSAAKARARLGWAARWDFDEAIERTASWYRTHAAGARGAELLELCRAQIAAHVSAPVPA